MNLDWILMIFAIGFLGSFISGMVGIGGSIINYPMLLFIPPILGFVAFSAQEVTAISAVQVLFASLMGMLVFRKGGLLNNGDFHYNRTVFGELCFKLTSELGY
jgi:uncharacterized protein